LADHRSAFFLPFAQSWQQHGFKTIIYRWENFHQKKIGGKNAWAFPYTLLDFIARFADFEAVRSTKCFWAVIDATRFSVKQ